MKRVTDLEKQYVMEVLEGQFRSSGGHAMVKRLEKEFADRFGVKFAIAHINGTATMHAALAAAGVGPGDEVIVPPLTMASTALVVLHQNAIPVFADVHPTMWTIDPQDIRRKVTERTKAIIPVAIYGLPPDMDAINQIAREYSLTVIEDDAQCFLGEYKGRISGSTADMASFSFQSSKQLTSGEGGMIITNNAELADKVRRFQSLGYAAVGAKDGKITKDVLQNPAYLRHTAFGFNYRMPELCAAVALAQVERIDELVRQRVDVARLYRQAIEGCTWLTPQHVPDGYGHVYWTFVMKLEDAGIGWTDFRGKYMELGGDGIYAAWQLTYREPLFQQRVFYGRECPTGCPHYGGTLQNYGAGLCPQAEDLQPRLLQLKTIYFDMDDAARKAEALYRTIRHFD